MNVVADPGFEAFTPNPSWTEASTSFGTPICSAAQCGTGGGTGPRNGFVWAWFGGIGTIENGSLEQSVVIPTDATTLDFYLEIPVSSGNGTDAVRAMVDGNVLFEAFEDDPVFAGVGYQLVSIDITAFADGASHQLRFESTVFGPEVSNFFIDDVSILGGSSECSTIVIDFETEDDFTTPLVNGQDISTPPEFGNILAISATGTGHYGPAIFDSDPNGPNNGTWPRDPDLLVDLGNVLILQGGSGPNPGSGDLRRPRRRGAGRDVRVRHGRPARARLHRPDRHMPGAADSGRRPDHDRRGRPDADVFRPRRLDERHLGERSSGVRDAPPEYAGPPNRGTSTTATASEDAGFDPRDVVRVEIVLGSSGALDNLVLR